MAVRLSALRTGRALLPKKSMILNKLLNTQKVMVIVIKKVKRSLLTAYCKIQQIKNEEHHSMFLA
jgi:hypothetical protein